MIANLASGGKRCDSAGSTGGTRIVAYPIWHKSLDGVAQHPSDGRERDASVAAGGFSDGKAGLDFAFSVGLLQNAESHPVFDTATQAEVFRFGAENMVSAVVAKLDGQEGSGAQRPSNE